MANEPIREVVVNGNTYRLLADSAEVRDLLTAEDNTVFQFVKVGNKYGYRDANNNFIPFDKVQAGKTVTAGTSVKTVKPDGDYDGLASVTINPTPSQAKSITAATSAQTVSPDSGKLLSGVTVNPQPHAATRATVTSNGTIDLGANHATRYVPVNVPQYSKPFEVITVGMRQLNQIDTCYLTRYNNGLAGNGTLVGSGNGRGGSYTLQGNYASYYYNAGVDPDDENNNTVTITLKVNAYIDGVYSSAGGTYSFTIGSGYSMPSHIVTPV